MTTGDNPDKAGHHPGMAFKAPDYNSAATHVAMKPQPDLSAGANSVAGIDPKLVEVKGAIEQFLTGQVVAQQGKPQSRSFFEGAGAIQGVGVACSGPSDRGMMQPGAQVLTVFVNEAITVDALKSLLIGSLGIPARAVANLPIRVVVTGPIQAGSTQLLDTPTHLLEAQQQTFRLRPAAGGASASISRDDVGAGTFGCLATGRSAPRNSRTLMLSCNHVIAASNGAQANECICQPAHQDDGSCPDDQIGIFETLVIIDFNGRPNYVDCATAWCWPDRVRRELISMTPSGVGYFRISNVPVQSSCNMAVGKTGRSTGLQMGYVTCQYTSCIAYYPGNRSARFDNQIAVVSDGAPFSDHGDSGSIVFSWNPPCSPIGLIFAGATAANGTRISFANPINYVLSSLDIDLLT